MILQVTPSCQLQRPFVMVQVIGPFHLYFARVSARCRRDVRYWRVGALAYRAGVRRRVSHACGACYMVPDA